VYSFDDYGGIWEGTEEDLQEYRVKQRSFYEDQFLKYIENKAEQDGAFLSMFVECCTSSSGIPYNIPGSKPWQIKVEFNLSTDPR
jgi:hypothetical protein